MDMTDIDMLSPTLGLFFVGVVLLVLAIFFFYKYMRNDARAIQKVFKAHAQEVVKDVVLFDGVDSYLFADYLLLIQGKIIVMKYDDSEGYIFGAENIHAWTCVKNNVTGKFANPLEKIAHFVTQVKQECGVDAVQGCVLFGSKASFPKGLPSNVLQMNTLDSSLTELEDNHIDQTQLLQAWNQLMLLVKKDKKEVGT